jgi:hypothetical protein
LPCPGAPAETVGPGALAELPRGGSALLVPADGGVHAGSLPEFDCDPPPVPAGGGVEPVPVPLGGVVVEPVPPPLGGAGEPAPGAVTVSPPEESVLVVAAGALCDLPGDDMARVAVLGDLSATGPWRWILG